MNIVVRDLFGDSRSGFLAIRTIDGTNTLSWRRNLFFTSHDCVEKIVPSSESVIQGERVANIRKTKLIEKRGWFFLFLSLLIISQVRLAHSIFPLDSALVRLNIPRRS